MGTALAGWSPVRWAVSLAWSWLAQFPAWIFRRSCAHPDPSAHKIRPTTRFHRVFCGPNQRVGTAWFVARLLHWPVLFSR